jgi:hypothetical protein
MGRHNGVFIVVVAVIFRTTKGSSTAFRGCTGESTRTFVGGNWSDSKKAG